MGAGAIYHAQSASSRDSSSSTIARCSSSKRLGGIEHRTSSRPMNAARYCLHATKPCVPPSKSSNQSWWSAWAPGQRSAPARPSATMVRRSAPSCTRAPPARRPIADGHDKPKAICAAWASSYKRADAEECPPRCGHHGARSGVRSRVGGHAAGTERGCGRSRL